MTDEAQTTIRTERLLDGGLLLIALGAAGLAVSLFLDWYGVSFGPSISAWTAFEIVDLILAVLAIAALVAIAERLFARGRPPLLPAWVNLVTGPVALLIVCVELIDEPPAAGGSAATIEVGAWIAFAAAAVMTVGALISQMRISLVVGRREAAAAQPSTPADPDAETRRYPTE
jgi:hypothetical protein